MTVGRWSWKSKSAKECVTTHLPNELALKMDGAKADYRYQAIERDLRATMTSLPVPKGKQVDIPVPIPTLESI
ncbi:hypothetical protein, conserved [Plasmodium berghei]|uniref:Uncharacterized protein n=1 Tax=Plasmodium berghei TaxID=5821 RepID=A0A1D3JPK8_PLABE|nr:hypothetical protein, conserved [Plasmodium berghei]SCL81838.1 hypothetical protein PBSP11A_000492600 [Plasmodium berghei]